MSYGFMQKSVTPKVSKPSKRELYEEKLKERKIFNNNFFDRFNDIGGGSPLRNNDGSLKTKRMSMLNENYEDIIYEKNKRQKQQNNNSNNNNNNYNYNMNNNMINMNDFQRLQYQMFQQLKNFQQQQYQRSRSPDVNNLYRNPYYQMNNINTINYNQNQNQNQYQNQYQYQPNYVNYNMDFYNQFKQSFNSNNNYIDFNSQFKQDINNQNNIINTNNTFLSGNFPNQNYSNQNFHYIQNPQLLNNINNKSYQRNYYSNIKRVNPDFLEGIDINTYNGIGIIPRDNYDKEKEREKKIEMRNEWLREMEEKKIRKKQNLIKEIELDKKADEKWKKEFEQEVLEQKMEKEKEMERYNNIQDQPKSITLQSLQNPRTRSSYYNI